MTADIKRMCLDKALAFLKAAEADYVVTFQGEVFQSEVPAPPPDVQKRKRTQVHNFVQDTDYIHKLRALSTGQTVRFDRGAYAVLKEKKAWDSFKASVTSQCRNKFGPNNYLIRSTEHCIEVLRAE